MKPTVILPPGYNVTTIKPLMLLSLACLLALQKDVLQNVQLERC